MEKDNLLSQLLALGFSDSLAQEALSASRENLEQAATYCLNRVTFAVNSQIFDEKHTGRDVMAHSMTEKNHRPQPSSASSLLLTAKPESSLYTSHLPIDFLNNSSQSLCAAVGCVKIHRVGVDLENEQNEVSFHMYTPTSVLVNSTYTIELDAFERREYTIVLDEKCDCDVLYSVAVRDSFGKELTLEALKKNTGTSHSSVGKPKAINTSASMRNAVQSLSVGEAYYVSRAGEDRGNGKGLELYYERKSKGDWQMEFRRRMSQSGHGKKSLDMNAPVSAKTYGTVCPSCNGPMEELQRYTSSDGFMGICRDLWACADENCCIVRVCDFEGYGDV